MNIQDALNGTRADLLRAMAAKLAARLDGDVLPAYLAPIARTLREIDEELRDIDAAAGDAVSQAASLPDVEWTP